VLVVEVVVAEDGEVKVVVWRVVSMDVVAVPVDVGVSVCALLSPVLEDAPVVVGLVAGEVVLPSVFEVSFVVVLMPAEALLSVEVGVVFANVDSLEGFSETIEADFAAMVCSGVEGVVDFALVDCLADSLPSVVVVALPVGTDFELGPTGGAMLSIIVSYGPQNAAGWRSKGLAQRRAVGWRSLKGSPSRCR
jgi:hypothetical protein